MSTDEIPIRFRKKRLQAYRGRGQLYSWLRAHRETIARGFAAGKLTWPIVCGECGRHGVMSRDGAEPSQRAAAKAWQTVVQDLAAWGLKPTDRMERPIYPSRMPKWTPPAILEAIAAGTLDAGGAAPQATSGRANALISPPTTGLAFRAAPPPPVPPPKPAAGRPLSQFADPNDSPEVQEAYADLEEQFGVRDWRLGDDKPKKRRTD